MNRRTQTLLRQHVDLLAYCVRAGIHSPAEAGRMANRAGVPFEAACRVITRAHAQRSASIRNARFGRLDLRRIYQALLHDQAELHRTTNAAGHEVMTGLKPKTCLHCQHSAVSSDWTPSAVLECRHAKSLVAHDPVSGHAFYNACNAMRNAESLCGAKARLFRQSETAPDLESHVLNK